MLPYHPPPADHAPPSSSPLPGPAGSFAYPANPETRFTEWCEVKSGSGEEAVEEAVPVLHPPEPGLHQRGQLADIAFSQVSQGSLQVRPHRFNRVQLVSVRWEPEDGQPVPCGDQIGHHMADVGVQAVPHDHERPAELLVRVVQQPGVIGFGEPLAPVIAGTAAVVHPVDQPGPLPGPDGDQRGQRHPLIAAAGHLDHRGLAAAAPGTSHGRP